MVGGLDFFRVNFAAGNILGLEEKSTGGGRMGGGG